MSFNGSGTFLRVMDWEADRDAGIKIRADRHDQEDDNFAAGLTNTITKDGQTQPVANIPMNGFKIINLGTPTTNTDAVTKAYVDSFKKFTNDIEVTDAVIFKDGTTTRGYIESAIGAGVAAKLTFETDNDAGVLVNRMALDVNGLNLRGGSYRLTPGDVLRGAIVTATGATPATSINAYDTAGVLKGFLSAGADNFYHTNSDVAVLSSTFQFRQGNVQRAGLIADFAPTDGAAILFIKNGSGTTRNTLTLGIGGAALEVGVYSAPSWVFPVSTVTMSGVITVPAPQQLQFSGTSSAAGVTFVNIKDTLATTGSVGNAVFSIKRQNSTTDCLILGNDGNGAALIGANNATMRFGNWVSGVFTDYAEVTTAGVWTFSASATDVIVGGANGGIELSGFSPQMKFTDLTTSAYDFWAHVDGNQFYILVDRDGNGSWDTPHPLQLDVPGGQGLLFGNAIYTTANLPAYPTVPPNAVASTPNTLAMRDGSGDISVRLVRSEYDSTNGSIGFIMTQIDTDANNYLRPSTPSQLAAALNGLVANAVYTGTDKNYTNMPIGHNVLCYADVATSRNNVHAVYFDPNANSAYDFRLLGGYQQLLGTWVSRGIYGNTCVMQRIT